MGERARVLPRGGGLNGAKIAVAGAGVGGLTTAIALARVGASPQVFERAPGPRAGGGPIWLYDNALKVLDQWGLGDEIRAAGTLIERHSYRNWRHEEIGLFPLAEISRRRATETPLLMIARNALDEILRAALGSQVGEDSISYGSSVAGYSETPDGIHLFLGPAMTATEDKFEILIGADGARSVIRAQLLGNEPLHASYTAWTGVAEATHWPYPAGESVTYLGNSWLLIGGADGARDGRRVLWVAIGPDNIMNDRRRWPKFVREIVAATPQPVSYAVRDRDPRWTARGRVTLLGDAAHPMMPAPGQGACQAIEDAAVLARAVGGRASLIQALRSYEEQRQRRIPRIWRFARSVTLMMLANVPSAAFTVGLRGAAPWVLDEYLFILDPTRS